MSEPPSTSAAQGFVGGRGVEPVDIGEQNQIVRLHHAGNARAWHLWLLTGVAAFIIKSVVIGLIESGAL